MNFRLEEELFRIVKPLVHTKIMTVRPGNVVFPFVECTKQNIFYNLADDTAFQE